MTQIAKVLIIDSNDPFRKALKMLLHSRFPALVFGEAANAEEALHKIDDFRPQLIFTDIRLSGISGLDLVKKVKTDYPDIIIFIITSFDEEEYRKVAREQGSNYFVSKDTSTAEEILSLVESIISMSNTTT